MRDIWRQSHPLYYFIVLQSVKSKDSKFGNPFRLLLVIYVIKCNIIVYQRFKSRVYFLQVYTGLTKKLFLYTAVFMQQNYDI